MIKIWIYNTNNHNKTNNNIKYNSKNNNNKLL
jgi:hypothetical protein